MPFQVPNRACRSVLVFQSHPTRHLQEYIYTEQRNNTLIRRVAPELNQRTYWLYKNAHTIDQSWVIKACGTRQRHIDQSQALTLYITSDYTYRQLLALYILAWEKGVKTIHYVRSKTVNA